MLWPPIARSVYVFGEVQLVQAPLSRRHSRVEAGPSVEANSKVALVLGVVSGGFTEMVVFGGKLTRHWYSAGLASMFPAGSVARTLNVCMPSVRPEYGGSIGTSHSV